jgi:hypothetical protein
MRAFYILSFAALLACSSDDAAVTDAGDAQADDVNADVDLGSDASTTYPAFTIDAPQVANLGGPTLKTPTVQPIFFPGFDYATEITDFTSKIGASSYWGGLSTYGINKLAQATPITLSTAQIVAADIGTISDAYIQSWLTSRFDGTHPEFGTTPDANTIYALFYPTSTTIYLGGGGGPTDGGVPDGGGFGGSKSCAGFGGYHGDVIIDNKDIAYAVLPECPTFGSLKGLDVSTSTTSHELSEAVTDPYPMGGPAYSQTDDNHIAWMFFLGGGEVGDMCAQFPTSFYKPSDLPYTVQRNWSNTQAKAGHDPCVPADATVYFNAMPVLPDKLARNNITTEGLNIPVGQPKVMEVDLFSDAPTVGNIIVSAQAFTRTGAAPVSFAFDKTAGLNGDKLHVTVTSTGAFTNSSKTATLVLTASNGARQNVWIGLLGQQ